jgi:hypothetical protein
MQFIQNPMNIVDLVAILPFYVGVIMRAVSADASNASGSLSFVRVRRPRAAALFCDRPCVVRASSSSAVQRCRQPRLHARRLLSLETLGFGLWAPTWRWQAVRMVRIFRVLKLGKYVQGLNLFKETLQLSAPALGVCPAMRPDRTGCPAMFRESCPLALPLPAQLSTHSASFSSKCDSARSRIECTVASQVLAFIIVIAIVLFSSVMFYAEKDLPLENHFESIPASMWLNRHAASSHRRWRPRALFEHAPCL